MSRLVLPPRSSGVTLVRWAEHQALAITARGVHATHEHETEEHDLPLV